MQNKSNSYKKTITHRKYNVGNEQYDFNKCWSATHFVFSARALGLVFPRLRAIFDWAPRKLLRDQKNLYFIKYPE